MILSMCLTFRCDIPVVFYTLNTNHITNSQNTTRFYCTVLYNMLHNYMFRPFFRPSIRLYTLALRVTYPDDKYTILMMRAQSSYNFSLIVAGV